MKALENCPKPEHAAGSDVIVKINKATICGTDLHILKGDVPSCRPGRILGHQGVGTVDEAGPAVSQINDPRRKRRGIQNSAN